MGIYTGQGDSLTRLQKADTVAELATVTGEESYKFLVNPEKEDWEHSANFSKLPVLFSPQPLVRYQSSESTLSFPRVLFWTEANDRDLTEVLKRVSTWVKNGVLLKLTWGGTVIDRCHIARFNYSVTQRRSGMPTQAEGSMSFILSPEPPKPEVDPAEPAKLSQREREKYADEVKEKLNKPNSTVTVDEDGKVTIDGKDGGFLGDYVELRPGLQNLGKKS